MHRHFKDLLLRLVDRYWFIVIVFLSLIVLPRLAIEYINWTGGADLRNTTFPEPSIDASNAVRKTEAWTEYIRHHIAWQVSSILFLLAALVVIVLSTAFIWELRRVARYVVFAIVVAFVSFAVQEIVKDEPALLSQHLSKALITPSWAVKQNYFGAISATRLDEAITISQSFTSASFIFLGFAVFAILSRSPICDMEGAIDQIVAQRDRMHILLFAASATLFFGVVAIHTLVEWRVMLQCVLSGASSLSDCPSTERRVVADAGAAILSLWTIAWTMVLMTLYIPARLILARRTEALYQEAQSLLGGKTRHQWLKDHGLQITYGDLVVKFVAMLGPLLAGKGFSLLAS